MPEGPTNCEGGHPFLRPWFALIGTKRSVGLRVHKKLSILHAMALAFVSAVSCEYFSIVPPSSASEVRVYRDFGCLRCCS